jgi:hypothetical protein
VIEATAARRLSLSSQSRLAGVVSRVTVLVALVSTTGACREPAGEAVLAVQLRDATGDATGCEALGVAAVQLTLYQREGDTVPYERAQWACETDDEGIFHAALELATGHYHRGEVQLLSDGGALLSVCTTQGTTQDRFPVQALQVEAGARVFTSVTVAGSPGRCTP